MAVSPSASATARPATLSAPSRGKRHWAGFHASELAGALEEATDQAKQGHGRLGVVTHANVHLAKPSTSPVDQRPVQQQPGEGIGLSIVKRLCDLLDATTELQSRAGVGTTYRILLPRRYEEVGA